MPGECLLLSKELKPQGTEPAWAKFVLVLAAESETEQSVKSPHGEMVIPLWGLSLVLNGLKVGDLSINREGCVCVCMCT